MKTINDINACRFRSLVAMAALLLSSVAMADPVAKVNVDFARRIGKIKPMHCVGQGPIQGWDNYSLFSYLKEAHIPFARLHDVGGAFGKMLYVDIPNLFRDFDADENDPANYDFTFTDRLLKAFVENGVEPFFRLGVTIENRTEVKKYRIYPPKDVAKWARICEHVVAHYNAGWADGFKFGIRYWEIWNEPDDRGDPQSSFMWCGTFADYCRLYEITSKRLKAKFPEIRIGGYASCGYYGAKKGVALSEAIPEDWRPKRQDHDNYHFIRCTLDFLDYVRDRSCPLDFFSFHSYDKPNRILEQITSVSREMKLRGISPELILDEWLPSPSLERVFSAEQNVDVARTLVGAQHSDLSMLMLYDARISARNPYAPLFNPMTAKPEGAYYALQYFGELYRRGEEAEVTVAGDGDGLCVCAATDGRTDGAVMLVNAGDKPVALDFGDRAVKFRFGSLTERDRNGVALFDVPKALPAKSFALLVFGL